MSKQGAPDPPRRGRRFEPTLRFNARSLPASRYIRRLAPESHFTPASPLPGKQPRRQRAQPLKHAAGPPESRNQNAQQRRADLPRNTARPFPPLAPPGAPCLTCTLPVFMSTSPTLSEHSSVARRPVSNSVKMMARSRLPVARCMVNLRRSLVLDSLQYSQALRIASTSSLVNVSTGATSKRGGGTSWMGSGQPNSVLAHAKKDDNATHTLRIVLGASGWSSPDNRCGL